MGVSRNTLREAVRALTTVRVLHVRRGNASSRMSATTHVLGVEDWSRDSL